MRFPVITTLQRPATLFQSPALGPRCSLEGEDTLAVSPGAREGFLGGNGERAEHRALRHVGAAMHQRLPAVRDAEVAERGCGASGQKRGIECIRDRGSERERRRENS